MSQNPASPQFLLLFRYSQQAPDPTPEEMQQIFGKWVAWMKGLDERGAFAGANRLEDTGKVLRGPGGLRVTDGPFAEAKEIMGGYVLVNAPNLAAATAIARECPGLEYGTLVEVRPVEPLPPI